jgi:predicted DNA-binding transcriptional regulator AlpA
MLQPQSASEPSRRAARSPLSDESLITGKQLRDFFGGCSEMHIWRLLNAKKYRTLAFPKPIKINDRNYWRLGAIRNWIREREAQSQRAIGEVPKQSRASSSKGAARRRSRGP